MYPLLAILSLGFLIIVHEGGHFFVARWCKMRVDRFSIGFGPGILKRKSKSGTIFQLAPIPFGGFVEIRGMNIAEEVDPDDPYAYPNRPAWQRFVTIFAGPATNYLSAIVLAFLLFTLVGQRSSWRWFEIARVNQGFDAQGKLEPGDRILAIDDTPILAAGKYTANDGTVYKQGVLREHVNAKKGAPVKITVMRNGARVDTTITPKLVIIMSDDDSRCPEKQTEPPTPCRTYKFTTTYLMGIVPIEAPDRVKIGPIAALGDSLHYPIAQTQMIAGGLKDIFTGKEEADPGGPKRIYDEFAKAWKLGIATGIELLMVLSVYLGLFNLFPLPALDGGRLVFLTYELVTRRRANPKIEAMVHMGGIMVLGVVMILVTLNDFHVF
jgi:regulator of sigma E protease